MDRDPPGVGVPLAEYADGVGITSRPKQYVVTNAAFLCTMADLFIEGAAVADSISWATFPFSSFYPSFVNTCIHLVRNAVGGGARGRAGGRKQPR